MEPKLTQPLETPDPEVTPKARRRSFSARYKQDILRQVDACSEPGEIGSLLRKEGLYSSHLTAWREQRETGALKELSKKRGRKASSKAEAQSRKQIAQLERDNKRLREKLEKAETIISVQKKLSQLLGLDERKGTR
jgi:transposase-like protein